MGGGAGEVVGSAVSFVLEVGALVASGEVALLGLLVGDGSGEAVGSG